VVLLDRVVWAQSASDSISNSQIQWQPRIGVPPVHESLRADQLPGGRIIAVRPILSASLGRPIASNSGSDDKMYSSALRNRGPSQLVHNVRGVPDSDPQHRGAPLATNADGFSVELQPPRQFAADDGTERGTRVYSEKELPENVGVPEFRQPNSLSLSENHKHAEALPAPSNSEAELMELKSVPEQPSWQAMISIPQLSPSNSVNISLSAIVPAALQFSKQIKVVQLQQVVTTEQVTQSAAQFDWQLFARKLWVDTNQPTGSDLTAGAEISRLRQEQWSGDAGLRRTNLLGGQFETSQNLQLQNSNSTFFDPEKQGLSKLTLKYNQPLLQKGGRLVNEGQIVLAQINTEVATADTRAKINDTIVSVVAAYWKIYRLRGEYCIQKALVDSTEKLVEELELRRKIDAQKSLIAQSYSLLASQRAELQASIVRIQQAQHELVRFVGDRTLDNFEELVPSDEPFLGTINYDLNSSFATALENRGELQALIRRIKSAELSRNIAQHEILPQLSLILETSASGLNGNYEVFKSVGDQFSLGGPSATAGLEFSVPVGNRLARSRARQTNVQLAAAIAAFDNAVDQVRQEVRDAISAVEGYSTQIENLSRAVSQSEIEVASMLERRLIFPSELDQVSQLYVREYLNALQRRATAERSLAGARGDFALAIVRLRYALGTILEQ
jgi:outer membrane protein TolC